MFIQQRTTSEAFKTFNTPLDIFSIDKTCNDSNIHYSSTTFDDPRVPSNTRNKLSLPHIGCLSDLVAFIRQELGSDLGLDSKEVNIPRLMEAFKAYQSNKADWEKFAHFSDQGYTRNLIDSGNGKYNLILLCWSEGQSSCIHNHENSHCLMKVMDGELIETLYEWPGGDTKEKLSKVRETVLLKNETTYINDSLGIHKVGNHSMGKKAVSLHLYSPALNVCSKFCEKTGQVQRVCSSYHTVNTITVSSLED